MWNRERGVCAAKLKGLEATVVNFLVELSNDARDIGPANAKLIGCFWTSFAFAGFAGSEFRAPIDP